MKNKKKHSLVKLIVSGTAIGVGTYAAISYQIFKHIFNLEKSKYTKKIYWKRSENYVRNEKWFLESNHTDEYINSYDGIRLHALKIENKKETHRWIIALHDYHACGLGLMDTLYRFDEMGFHLLVPDARACGLSAGKYTGLGWPEHFDLIQWINHLLTIDSEAEIYLYGVGMGASTIMYVLGEYLPKQIKLAIVDSGYSNLKELLIREITKNSRFSGNLFIKGIDILVKQNLHYSLEDVNVIRQVSNAKIPVLFLCAGSDNVISPRVCESCYLACTTEKDMKVYPDCVRGNTWMNVKYFDDINDFIVKNNK